MASRVAAQSGALKIFDWQEERIPEAPELASPGTWTYITPDNAGQWTKLSDRMKTVPALEVEGLNLKGDVLSVAGKNADAKRAYERASQRRASPLSEQRIKMANYKLGKDTQG